MLSVHFGIEYPTLYKTENTIHLTEDEIAEISEEVAFMADISADSAKTAVLDMKNMQHLLLDKSGKKQKIISHLEKLAAPFTKNFLLSSYFRTDDLEKAKKYANIYT